MTSKYNSILIEDITEFLNSYFSIDRFPIDERGGVYLQTVHPVKRLGLVLEPNKDLYKWIIAQSLDALFIHRPWKLEVKFLPPELGIISYHLPFDECLTIGFNLRLAQLLRMSNLEVLGEKENRAIGMLGGIKTQSFASLCNCITQIFAGNEQVHPAFYPDVKRIAVVGAMTDLLVREAADRGADVYITGQFRKPAQAAIQETKMGVIAVGHSHAEAWGLRGLAEVLQERWLSLEVVVFPQM